MRRWLFILLFFMNCCIEIEGQSSYLQLTNIPSLYIETTDGKEIVDKTNYIICKVVLVDGDKVDTYENTQIRGRGNSSWYAQKKPYRLKFAKKQAFLGTNFAKAKSWTLLANHADKTMIRNALTYDLGKFMGFSFCPAAIFVDLFLNGCYRGTYQISDQVQVNSRRVEVDESTGWLLELTDNIHKDDPYIVTDRNFYINIKNPDDENLTTSCLQEIKDWCNQLSSTIWSDDYCNPNTGYRSMIDEQSFIDWYIATELTGNVDGFNSIYAYKEQDESRLHFGPLWDEDLGYNNSSERDWTISLLSFTNHEGRPLSITMRRLWNDYWFAQTVNDRWNELLNDGLQSYLIEKIDSLSNLLVLSQEENFKLWPIDETVYGFERQDFHQTYEAYIDDLKDFINRHIFYMSQKFSELLKAASIQRISIYDNSEKIFNMTGQRVFSPTKHGVYIRGKKKVIL